MQSIDQSLLLAKVFSKAIVPQMNWATLTKHHKQSSLETTDTYFP